METCSCKYFGYIYVLWSLITPSVPCLVEVRVEAELNIFLNILPNKKIVEKLICRNVKNSKSCFLGGLWTILQYTWILIMLSTRPLCVCVSIYYTCLSVCLSIYLIASCVVFAVASNGVHLRRQHICPWQAGRSTIFSGSLVIRQLSIKFK